ncbi:MAG: tRNA lysidine(34) synthetase TilS [bacterium]|nr:tRNA lysidine(34) synthetase TilS [bacterium]
MDALALRLANQAQEHGWIEAGQRILVSLSGGADSTALACILSEWKPKFQLELLLVHFNHHLRAESEDEAAFCQKLANQLGLPLEIFAPEAPLGGAGIQAASRAWRRQTLLDRASSWGAHRIALGHQIQDQAETLLWRMLRGTSLIGLKGMRPLEIPWFRPLLELSRADLIDYLGRREQAWMEDPSNARNDYQRNRIRNQLLPLLDELSGTQSAGKLAKLAREAQDLEAHFLDLCEEAAWSSAALSYDQISDLKPLFAMELLHRFLLDKGVREIGRHQLEDVLRLVLSGKGGWQVNLKDGLAIEGKGRLLRVGVAG